MGKLITEQDALNIAAKWGLLEEVQKSLDSGATPEEALIEWDLYNYK